MPHGGMKASSFTKFWPLFLFASSVPFILGLDDFAGYVPLFSVINVFGFAIGVFLGHMILNILLYISPERTISCKTASNCALRNARICGARYLRFLRNHSLDWIVIQNATAPFGNGGAILLRTDQRSLGCYRSVPLEEPLR